MNDTLDLTGQGRETAFAEAIAFLRLEERIAILFFLYTGVLACAHPLDAESRAVALGIAPLIWLLAFWESRFSRPWSRVTRDWTTLGLILLGYSQIRTFSLTSVKSATVYVWEGWDRVLLDQLGLRAAVESFGPMIPSGLEAIYLLLYAFPAVCLGLIYTFGRRASVSRFLTTLLLGTFSTYTLLPYILAPSPLLAVQITDLPHYEGFWRSINVWLLQHYDLNTSVFPSGHVAVAFSSAFGLARAIPERTWVWRGVVTAAALVWIATVYCRYHYAADGCASLAISLLAWRVSEALEKK